MELDISDELLAAKNEKASARQQLEQRPYCVPPRARHERHPRLEKRGGAARGGTKAGSNRHAVWRVFVCGVCPKGRRKRDRRLA